MPLPSVYLETSVLSYLAARPSRDLITAAHQQVTTLWWERRRSEFDVYLSELVLSEAAGGDAKTAHRRLSFAVGLRQLAITDNARSLAARLLTVTRLPTSAEADAVHVALAAVHGIDFLLTWNVRHIASAETRRHVEAACRTAGFRPPVLCTPEELLGEQGWQST